MRTAGIILDVYDDPHGLVLRGKLAGAALPEKLASACLLDRERLDQLPDRLFGLVGENNGAVLRKYAMHDEAHLMTSIIYFMECGRQLLPEEAMTKVASNLVNACAWYEIDPPEGLVKEALGVIQLGMGALGASEMKNVVGQSTAKRQKLRADFRRAQMGGTKHAAGSTTELSHAEEQGLAAGKDTPGHVDKVLARRDNHVLIAKKLDEQVGKRLLGPAARIEKKADLTGTELMPRGILSKSIRSSPTKNVASSTTKVASWQDVGSLTGRDAITKVKQASYTHFALPHRRAYPLDTAAQVKTAEVYFDDYCTLFPLPERRVFAQQTYARAQEMGLKIAGRLLDYAGEIYGPFIDAELNSRAVRFEGTASGVLYETLMEKRASLSPAVMAQLLMEADAEVGVDQSYGRTGVGLRNPYEAVYGSAKVAETQLPPEEAFSWVQGNDYVNGPQLRALATSNTKLDATFGGNFAKSFLKDPVGIFKSMPDPQKVVLSRLASDTTSTAPP